MEKIEYKIKCLDISGHSYVVSAISPEAAMIEVQTRFYHCWMGPYINRARKWSLVSDFGRELNFEVTSNSPIKKKSKIILPEWFVRAKVKSSGEIARFSCRGKDEVAAKKWFEQDCRAILDLIEVIDIKPAFMEGV